MTWRDLNEILLVLTSGPDEDDDVEQHAEYDCEEHGQAFHEVVQAKHRVEVDGVGRHDHVSTEWRQMVT